ncbi:type II toxin-antitoxin system VapC family toxin [bacterium]|nr:type II toxin-antitoxin system VapC family toxin [bacterium]
MIVIDSSFFLSNLFVDETHSLVKSVFELIHHSQLVVLAPPLFFYEVHNSLIMAIRRKRIEQDLLPMYLELISLAPINLENKGLPSSITILAISHNLSFYDASYLELSKRKNIPLATLDKRLHAAAIKEKIVYS